MLTIVLHGSTHNIQKKLFNCCAIKYLFENITTDSIVFICGSAHSKFIKRSGKLSRTR